MENQNKPSIEHQLFTTLTTRYPESKNATGFMLLASGHEPNSVRIVEEFIKLEEAEDYLNQQDDEGNTPLHYVVRDYDSCSLLIQQRKFLIYRFLMAAGVDPLIENHAGISASNYVTSEIVFSAPILEKAEKYKENCNRQIEKSENQVLVINLAEAIFRVSECVPKYWGEDPHDNSRLATWLHPETRLRAKALNLGRRLHQTFNDLANLSNAGPAPLEEIDVDRIISPDIQPLWAEAKKLAEALLRRPLPEILREELNASYTLAIQKFGPEAALTKQQPSLRLAC